MPDLLNRIRKELGARARGLRPIVGGFEGLGRATVTLARAGARSVPGLRSRVGASGAAQTTGGGVARKRGAGGSNGKPATRRASQPRRGAASRRKHAPRGQTQAKVLDALAAEPGSTTAAVAKASGIPVNVAAATVSRLVKQGRVRRLEGGGYTLVEAATGSHPNVAPAAPAKGPPEQTSAAQVPEEPPPSPESDSEESG